MDVKKFKEIKRRYQLASEPVFQTKPDAELEARSEPQSELAGPTQPVSIDQTKPKPDTELEFLPESRGYLESVAMIEREDSIGCSGWGYSQLLKEFRN